jgi:hypothetical protein
LEEKNSLKEAKMKTFVVNGKTYTDKQLESAVRRFMDKKDGRPLTDIMDEVLPEGDAPPVYQAIVAVQEDEASRFLARHELERGIEGFGGVDPLLNVVEFLIDLYIRLRRK